MSSRFTRKAGGALAAILLAACAEPTGNGPAIDQAFPNAAQAPGGGQLPAAIEWNDIARGLVAKNSSNTFFAFRVYAITSVAQLRALQAAEQASTKGHLVSRRAAIAAASSVALTYLYPADAQSLDSIVRAQVDSEGWLERDKVDAAAGETIGRTVAAEVVEFSKSDGYDLPFTGTVPTGPGMWYSATTPPTPPSGFGIGDARTFFLTSSDQFRPPPPPPYGSPDFLFNVAEVRRISDTRTPQQDSIAKFWALGAGTHTPPGYWNLEATTLALKYHLNERRATQLLALLNMVAMDAIIASHDAKYAYWLIRPSQEDPGITLSMGLPNFPSYPSNHATISAAMAEVLASAFPREANRLRAAADEAALSRVLGGIHYPFDGTVGLALGRRIARWVIQRERMAI